MNDTDSNENSNQDSSENSSKPDSNSRNLNHRDFVSSTQYADSMPGEMRGEAAHWSMQILQWVDARFQPVLGWGVLALTLLLLCSTIYATNQSRWISAQSSLGRLVTVTLCAVVCAWWLYGWRKDRTLQRFAGLRILGSVFFYLLLGLVLVTEIIVRWLPSSAQWIDAVTSRNWSQPALLMLQNVDRLLARILLWWQVLQAEEPVRDDLVLTLFAGLLLWLMAGITVALLRRTWVGLVAAVPTVALTIGLLYWGREDRSAIVIALTAALLLHVWLHQRTLQLRWEKLNLDYSPSLLIDRLISAGGATVLVIVIASLLPNLYIRPLALWYWQLMSPANQRINEFRQQILPDFVSSTRWRSGVGRGGLPNEFMLGAGPQELGNMLVMHVRTNESAFSYDQEPSGFYMRALTLQQYDGKGWRNPNDHQLQELPANQRWIGSERSGRRLLVQSVETSIDSPMLFAAGEVVEASVDSEVDWLPNGELIGFRSWERRYTVVSSVPAVGAQTLNAAGDWGGDNRMSSSMQPYLQLPDSVPPRVYDLAAELTFTGTTLFEKASEIEQYLRQFPYDLTVPEPPTDISDVADYFLFDLQRGYCDYYATAFIVLARAAGIPTRMATGYAVGSWNFSELQWTITEAQAHSWPEVYFPQYGWIPFEPTAGRSQLTRIDQSPVNLQLSGGAQATTISQDEAVAGWNWQMLIWLLPLALLLWGGYTFARQFLDARRDPWQTLLRWGARRGHPLANGETILEYGGTLSNILEHQADRSPGNDGLRSVAREVAGISEAVSEVRYATQEQRKTASGEVESRWQRIKDYVR